MRQRGMVEADNSRGENLITLKWTISLHDIFSRANPEIDTKSRPVTHGILQHNLCYLYGSQTRRKSGVRRPYITHKMRNLYKYYVK